MAKENRQHRTTLPVKGRSEVNFCSVLSLSKDLSKVSMPVNFNEPLSFLQRVTEYMEYSKLLKQASLEQTAVERLQYIAAFAVSALACNWERLGKPFNPILGETYELERDDFRILCEQVSHHPPVSAFHSDNENFIFHGSIQPKIKFWGKSIEIHPKGTVTVELPKWNEAYTWQNVNCILHNVLVGQIWMEQSGSIEIKQHGGADLRAILNFKSAGYNNKDLHRVDGFISDSNKRKVSILYGKWTERLRVCEYSTFEEAVERLRREAKSPSGSPGHKKVLARLHSLKVGAFKSMQQVTMLNETENKTTVYENEKNRSNEAEDTFDEGVDMDDLPSIEEVPGSVTLWEATPRPVNSADYFQFTEFAMSLNELETGTENALCPTDSRLRPDVRKLETGDLEGAAVEKIRLEEKQRETRKTRKQKKAAEWTPRWFSNAVNPYTGQEDWLYNGDYWDRNYTDIHDIF